MAQLLVLKLWFLQSRVINRTNQQNVGITLNYERCVSEASLTHLIPLEIFITK